MTPRAGLTESTASIQRMFQKPSANAEGVSGGDNKLAREELARSALQAEILFEELRKLMAKVLEEIARIKAAAEEKAGGVDSKSLKGATDRWPPVDAVAASAQAGGQTVGTAPAAASAS